MKKAIHIAGFIIGVIVVYALAIAALAQKPPQKAKIQSTPFCFLDGAQIDCDKLPQPPGNYVVGEDGPEIRFNTDKMECVIVSGGSRETCRNNDQTSTTKTDDAEVLSWDPTNIHGVQCQGPDFKDCKNLDSPKASPSNDNCDPRILTFCGPVSKVCDDATGKCRDVDLLDVPATPKYEDGDIEYSTCRLVGGKGMMICPNPIQAFVGWTCTDKSRFLLYSEDGKAHCLKLVPHDQ